MGNLLDTDILDDYELSVNPNKITELPWTEMCQEDDSESESVGFEKGCTGI
jgi:hypothetical protein